jgi:hypothetical protein
MSEFDNINSILCCNFCEEWDHKTCDNSITLTRDTGDHKETIRVSKNDMWDVTVKIMDREDQIFTPTSYNAHHDRKVGPMFAPVVDKTFSFLMNEFSNKKPRDLGNFQFGIIVEKESCNIGKRHNHFYKTSFISLRMKDPENIMPFLRMRYEFFNLD